MTLDELKAEAKRQGYKLIKVTGRKTVILDNCVCGGRFGGKVAKWIGPGGYKFKCDRCGFESPPSKNEADARRLWNEAIKKEKEKSKC